LNIFTKVILSDLVRELVLPEYLDYYSGPILKRSNLDSKIALVERLIGQNQETSDRVGRELVKDIERATDYPPEVYYMPTIEELCEFAQDIKKDLLAKPKTDAGEAGV
jgi:hypothetical protein